MDLFTPVISEDAQHANFRTITKFANAYNEDVLNEWAAASRTVTESS